MKSRYQYRIYPNSEQKQALSRLFGCVRVVWNDCLALCQRLEKYPGINCLCSMLTNLKQFKERQWLAEVACTPLQQTLRDLDLAYRQFFKSCKGERKGPKLRPPRFKRRTSAQSARFTRGGFKIDGDRVYLTKVGKLKIVWSRPLPSVPSSVTVIKDCADRYFLSFVVEVEPVSLPAKNESIGIDLGIKTFAVMSDGTKAHSPDYSRCDRKIRKLQKKLARQQKGSKRRERTRIRIAKQHNRIADTRKDFLHKLSTQVVRENQAIVLEDLNVSGMVKNRRLARAISQQGWRAFRTLCEAKADKYSREFQVVSRWEPTSQVCSCCGFRWGKLDLSVRSILCLSCGTEQDRDENAAKNIEQSHHRALGDSKRTGRAGKTGSPAQPSEPSRITVASAR